MNPQKALQKQQLEVVTKASSAIRRLATAASEHFGGDCYLHAAIGQALLARAGIQSRIVVGYAAWRVGMGDGDVISHTTHEVSYLPPGVDKGLPFHAWLEVGPRILDFTTYQLRKKAAELDAMDGGKTNVAWSPDFLFAKKEMGSPYREVAQVYKTGVFHYQEIPGLHETINAERRTLDPEDILHAEFLMDNQNVMAFGPNNLHKRPRL